MLTCLYRLLLLGKIILWYLGIDIRSCNAALPSQSGSLREIRLSLLHSHHAHSMTCLT